MVPWAASTFTSAERSPSLASTETRKRAGLPSTSLSACFTTDWPKSTREIRTSPRGSSTSSSSVASLVASSASVAVSFTVWRPRSRSSIACRPTAQSSSGYSTVPSASTSMAQRSESPSASTAVHVSVVLSGAAPVGGVAVKADSTGAWFGLPVTSITTARVDTRPSESVTVRVKVVRPGAAKRTVALRGTWQSPSSREGRPSPRSSVQVTVSPAGCVAWMVHSTGTAAFTAVASHEKASTLGPFGSAITGSGGAYSPGSPTAPSHERSASTATIDRKTRMPPGSAIAGPPGSSRDCYDFRARWSVVAPGPLCTRGDSFRGAGCPASSACPRRRSASGPGSRGRRSWRARGCTRCR